jgi:hypothetical protein
LQFLVSSGSSEPSWGRRTQSPSNFNFWLWVSMIWINCRIFCTLY